MTMLVLDDEPIRVSVSIGHRDFDLGKYGTIVEAATAMTKWVRDRGLAWAPDTNLRLHEAHRTQAAVLILDVWKAADVSEWRRARRQAWHLVDVDPYSHVAYRMTTAEVFPWLNQAPID